MHCFSFFQEVYLFERDLTEWTFMTGQNTGTVNFCSLKFAYTIYDNWRQLSLQDCFCTAFSNDKYYFQFTVQL